MGSQALETIRSQIKSQGEIPIHLDLGYKVIFSTLQGNLPVNNRVTGKILDFPVDLELGYTVIPNTGGSFPVNSEIHGTIGDAEIDARMSYKMVFSTVAGNIPVNNGVQWKVNGTTYGLDMPYTLVTGAALTGAGIAKSKVVRAKRVFDAKFIRGKIIQVDVVNVGGHIAQEAGRPICTGIMGMIEDIEVDARFSFTYFCNTSTGRSPVNTRLDGVLRLI